MFLFGINSALVVPVHHALFSFPMLAFSLLVRIINSQNLNSNRVTSIYLTTMNVRTNKNPVQ